MIKKIIACDAVLFLFYALLLVISCSTSEDATREGDGGNTAPSDSGNTAPSDSGNTAPSDSGSTVPSDSSPQSEGGEESVCQRPVLKYDVTNARDIGDWPLAGGKHVRCRRVMRGGTLVPLSEAGCAEFAELQIHAIVDLREASVQASSPPPACTTSQAKQILAPMPKLLPDTPENYLALMEQTEAVRTVFDVLGDSGSYPVYLHCEIGRDRTNFIVALILLALGADRETVVEEFELSESAGVDVKTECIEAVIDEVERRGGIDGVLETFGVSQTKIDMLRTQLIEE
ncbi:MAG: tyrosine-protein phosphatase [Deltaproteobacteria bacterium]|nr:tyrosine-protein phosphatase [Deltaproteobacteria bacterium]